MQSNRGGRVGATSWVQMSSANPAPTSTGADQQQQQHDNPRSSLSSLRNTSSSSMRSGSTSSGSFGFSGGGGIGVGANIDGSAMVSAPSSFISPPINSLALISDQIASTGASVNVTTGQQQQQQSIGGSSSSSISNSNFDQQVVAATKSSNLVSSSMIATSNVNDELERQQKEEENRKLRLQLYVFVLRCISYSFNAKQTSANELHHRQQQLKLRKSQLEQIIHLHTRFLSNGLQSFAPSKCPHQHLKLSPIYLKQLDELYERCHLIFNRKFLQNERMKLLVESECCSQQDLRELFRQSIEQIMKESGILSQSNKLIGGISYHSTTPASKRMSLRDTQQSAGSGNSATGEGLGGLASSSGRFNEGRGSFKIKSEQANLENENSIGGFNSLLASKDVIINSWLIKFESIIREDPNSSDLNSTGSINLTEPLAPPLSATPTQSSGNVSTTTITTVATTSGNVSNLIGSLSQQQQQQNFTKEQLYQMFQNILNIKKFEHQLLYNALQLDSADEQAAAIRRELDGRIARIAELERNKKLMPKFVLKEMESLYLEEARMSVNKLMVNLDSLPVMKGSSNESRGGVYGLQKFRRYNNR